MPNSLFTIPGVPSSGPAPTVPASVREGVNGLGILPDGAGGGRCATACPATDRAAIRPADVEGRDPLRRRAGWPGNVPDLSIVAPVGAMPLMARRFDVVAGEYRITVSPCEAAEAALDAWRAATADGMVDPDERRLIDGLLVANVETCSDVDEQMAIVVVGFRRGTESPRFRRLLAERGRDAECEDIAA